MKKIILTGGGTAGHVTPNIALVPTLSQHSFEIRYIGSHDGIEKDLVEKEGIPYDGISSGKLRRYFSLKNFTDPFRVCKGYTDARKILKREKPDIIFSKGGFVTVPVVLAAKRLNIPVVIHESDMTPGLANRLSIPSADRICCNFPETLKHLPKGRSIVTGQPLRKELLIGNRLTGLSFTGLSANHPILLVMGGSTGSVKINNALRQILPELLKDFQVVHLCGKGKKDPEVSYPGYIQYEYLQEELKDVFACADIIISRAGASSVCELLALRKPNILIPLSTKASRGDQILNATSFKKRGFSAVLEEENLNDETLLALTQEVFDNRAKYIATMTDNLSVNSVDAIVSVLEEVLEEN